MGNNSKGSKQKSEKVYTRMQAIRAIKNGTVPPERFLSMEDPFKKKDPKNPGQTLNHDNYHVKNLAWKLMGRPMPFEGEEKAKFLKSIHVKDDSVVETDATEPTKEEINE